MNNNKFKIPMPEGVSRSDSLILAMQRLFCLEEDCPHWDAECADGQEHTFVLCPKVAEREREIALYEKELSKTH